MIRNTSGTFSADVKIQLIVGDAKYEVGQLGPDFALLGEPHDIDAAEGVIKLTVDGKATGSRVRITAPPTKESRRFEFEAFEQMHFDS